MHNFANLLCLLAWAIERGPLWAQSSPDVLVDAPMPLAGRRARRIPLAIKRGLADEIRKGTFFRTPGFLGAALARFAKFGDRVAKRNKAEDGCRRFVYDSWQAGRAQFGPARVKVISVAFDGTRMAGRDTLYSALYARGIAKAMWLPPQAFWGSRTAIFAGSERSF